MFRCMTSRVHKFFKLFNDDKKIFLNGLLISFKYLNFRVLKNAE